ncbi:MAG: zf-HC2 domain-containing protein [Candidatus Solibacter sp.]
MTKCWSEGELRAYLDRELSTGDMQQVAAHLGECTACDCLCTELAGRAAHVSALMDLLPEWEGASIRLPARPVVVTVKPQQHAWVGLAVALAAGLAAAVYLMPKPAPQVAAIRPAPVTPAIAPQATPAELALVPESVDEPAPRRVRKARKAVPDREYFIALDNEPFESGVIMRVDVKPGNVQADVVFGPDGRAHAFRLVNAVQRY